MHRITASYKLTHVLGKTVKDKLKDKLWSAIFSLNLDETTLNNSLHLLTLLVSYYDPSQNDVVTNRLPSVDMPSVDASSLFDKIKEIFEKCNLSFSKLLAMLMDSCSVMRGENSRLKTRVHEVALHLIDVDEDHVIIFTILWKKITSHFRYYLEGLFHDIYHDFQHSASSLEILEGMALHSGLSFHHPSNYVVTCWLLVLDPMLSFSYMLNVYTAQYNSICIHNAKKALNKCKREHKKHKTSELEVKLVKEEKNVDILVKRQARIYANNYISELSKSELSKLQDKAVAKTASGTAKGKECKNCIIAKLFKQRKLKLHVSFCKTLLPMFKRYIMLFQREEPLIHKVHYEQVKIIKRFLSHFVLPSNLVGVNSSKVLKKLWITENDLLPNDTIFIGSKARKIVKNIADNNLVKEFMDAIRKCSGMCRVHNTEAATRQSIFENNIDEKLDEKLPSAFDSKGYEVKCLDWWIKVSTRYPTLFKI